MSFLHTTTVLCPEKLLTCTTETSAPLCPRGQIAVHDVPLTTSLGRQHSLCHVSTSLPFASGAACRMSASSSQQLQAQRRRSSFRRTLPAYTFIHVPRRTKMRVTISQRRAVVTRIRGSECRGTGVFLPATATARRIASVGIGKVRRRVRKFHLVVLCFLLHVQYLYLAVHRPTSNFPLPRRPTPFSFSHTLSYVPSPRVYLSPLS